ncbi:MAG TPA: ATPase domain-containing protein [Methanomassiliicoccales archaeon]|jgi:KaiC/GvpD/RAD55 family RecA-like ATPase
MASSKKLDAVQHEVRLDPGGSTAEVSPASKEIEGADLRSWLEGGDDFLAWLDEGAEDPHAADNKQAAAVEASSEYVAELNEKLKKYEDELRLLKQKLAEAFLDNASDQTGKDVEIDLGRKLQELIEAKDQLALEVDRLQKLNNDIKQHFEQSLVNVSEDKSSLLMKEIELKEKESKLLTRMRELELRQRDASSYASKEVEANLEERFHTELRQKEAEWRYKEQQLQGRIQDMEKELLRLSMDLKLKDDKLKLSNMGKPDIEKAVAQKYEEMMAKEKEVAIMQGELDQMKIQIREKDDELKKIKDVITYKEDELNRREEDMMYREKVLSGEKRKFEETRKELSGTDEVELKKRIEELRNEVQKKEEDLRAKERFLNAKGEEIRMRESGLIEDEIKAREKDRVLEATQAKVKTGNTRLDDLLLGGIPFGSNIMVHGPPFVGKEVMVNSFVAEGLKKGIPALWVITDKTPKDIREEMKFVLSGYDEYERKGLVRYIDAFSRSMGDESKDEFTTYIDEPTDHEKISEAVENITKAFRETHEYYRMAFRSISTLIAYSDPNTAFRFLSPLCGKRKRDKAVSMFTVEKGMHGEQEIQMLGSIMDGMIDFKVDQLKTFFSIQGISEVQSRAYIRYTSSKHALQIGSFALDHIR